MHQVIRQSQLAAIGSFTMGSALKVPRELTCETLDRAVRWGRASLFADRDLPAVLSGILVEPRKPVDYDEIAEAAGTAKLVRVEEPLGRRTFRFEHELLGLPDGFEAHCSKAREIHLVFGTALGGDSGAMLAAVEILNTAVGRGAFVSAHVEKFAGSAHADLYVLTPGRRSMAPDATLLLHQGHRAVFADASGLRAAAEELERWEVGHVAMMAKRTGQTPAVVRSWLRPGQDVTFSAGAALGCGLIDAIVGEAAP